MGNMGDMDSAICPQKKLAEEEANLERDRRN